MKFKKLTVAQKSMERVFFPIILSAIALLYIEVFRPRYFSADIGYMLCFLGIVGGLVWGGIYHYKKEGKKDLEKLKDYEEAKSYTIYLLKLIMPEAEPCDSLAGMLSQIDHAIAHFKKD